jgi:hypothetical protein
LVKFLLNKITSGNYDEKDDGFQPLTTRHPLLTQVEAPTLKNYGTSFFEKFMAKRELYDANLARQNASDPSFEFVPTPLNNCIENEVLEGTCECDLDCTVDSVIDEQLIEYFAPYLKVGGKAPLNLIVLTRMLRSFALTCRNLM